MGLLWKLLTSYCEIVRLWHEEMEQSTKSNGSLHLMFIFELLIYHYTELIIGVWETMALRNLFSWILDSVGPIGGNPWSPCLIVIWLSWWVPGREVAEMFANQIKGQTKVGVVGNIWYDSMLSTPGGNQTELLTIGIDVSIKKLCPSKMYIFKQSFCNFNSIF